MLSSARRARRWPRQSRTTRERSSSTSRRWRRCETSESSEERGWYRPCQLTVARVRHLAEAVEREKSATYHPHERTTPCPRDGTSPRRARATSAANRGCVRWGRRCVQQMVKDAKAERLSQRAHLLEVGGRTCTRSNWPRQLHTQRAFADEAWLYATRTERDGTSRA